MLALATNTLYYTKPQLPTRMFIDLIPETPDIPTISPVLLVSLLLRDPEVQDEPSVCFFGSVFSYILFFIERVVPFS